MRSIRLALMSIMLVAYPFAIQPQKSQCDTGTSIGSFAHENIPFVAEYVSHRTKQPAHAALVSEHCGPACKPGILYVRADALFLDRDNSSRNQTVVENAFTFQPIVTTADLGFDAEAGPRLIAGYEHRCGWGLEGSYFGLQNWDARAVATGNNDLAIPGDIGLATFDFVDADRMQVDYSGDFHSAELNGTRRLERFQHVRLLAGFRYVNLDEVFNINSTDANFGTSDFDVRASNDLYGGQLGMMANASRSCVGVELVGKAGIFGNDGSQRTLLRDNDNLFVLRDVSSQRSRTAFVGEFGVSAYALLTKRLRASAGYTLLWINGVALAADQLDFTDTPTSSAMVSANDEAFFHGAHVGMEATW